jgi:hypothetical protein
MSFLSISEMASSPLFSRTARSEAIRLNIDGPG